MVKITIKKKTLERIGLIFVGILIALLILEVVLRVGGFVLLSLQHKGSTIAAGGGV
ncbi:hypothetical protein J4206_07765 [Candidatus Woesearchaeota archaeon]|nr:hypothetical protein [Candidatus Woesearchaeota archaeon]